MATAILSSGAPSAAVGQRVQLGVKVTDADDPLLQDALNPLGGSSAKPCGVPLTFAYSWKLVLAPVGSQATLSSALANPTFVPDVPSSGGVDYVFSVTVTSSTGKASAPSFLSLPVGTCGSLAPTVTLQAPTGWITGRPLGAPVLAASVTDPNEAAGCALKAQPFQYAWSLTSTPAGSQVALTGAAQSSPSFTPDVPGSYSVSVVVTDALGLSSAPGTATVQVSPCNAPLTVTIQLTTGAPVTGSPVGLLALPTDWNAPGADGGPASCTAPVLPFTYAWTLVSQPLGSLATLNHASSSSPSFVPDLAGDYALSVIVTDAAGNASAPLAMPFEVLVPVSCAAPLLVTQVSVNGTSGAVPVAVPFPVSAGVPVQLAATVSDPNQPGGGVLLDGGLYDGGSGGCTAQTLPYSYLWSLVSAPAGSRAALSDRTSATPSLTPDLVGGTYSLAVVVTDAQGNRSNPAQFDLTAPAALACDQPLNVGPLTVTPPNPVTDVLVSLSAPGVTNPNAANCYASVPGGSALAYQWTLLSRPAGSAAALWGPFLPAPSLVPDRPGAYVAGVRVVDGLGNAASGVLTVIAAPCGQPSVTANGPPGAETGQTVPLVAQVTDSASSCGGASVAPFSYVWQLTPPPGSRTAVLQNGSGPQTQFIPDVSGTYAYSVQVTDGSGAVSVAQGTVGVESCVPTLTVSSVPSGNNLAIGTSVGLNLALGLNAGCASPPPYRASWSLLQAPFGSTASLLNPGTFSPSLTLDRPAGIWVAECTVTDGLTGTNYLSLPISVSTSACGSNPTNAYAGVWSASPLCNGTNCTSSGLPVGTATARFCPPFACGAPTPDVTIAVGVVPLPYNLELFAGDPTAVGPTTTRPSAGSPNAACGGVLRYNWIAYQVPAGSTLPNGGFGPSNAAGPTARLDVKGDYVFQLAETDQVTAGTVNLPPTQTTGYLWVRVQ